MKWPPLDEIDKTTRESCDFFLQRLEAAHPKPIETGHMLFDLSASLNKVSYVVNINFLLDHEIISKTKSSRGIDAYRFHPKHDKVFSSILEFHQAKVKQEEEAKEKKSEEGEKQVDRELDRKVKRSTLKHHKRYLIAVSLGLVVSIGGNIRQYMASLSKDRINGKQDQNQIGNRDKDDSPRVVLPSKSPEFTREKPVISDTFHSPKDTIY